MHFRRIESLFLDVLRDFSMGVRKAIEAFPANRSLFFDALRNFSKGVEKDLEAKFAKMGTKNVARRTRKFL